MPDGRCTKVESGLSRCTLATRTGADAGSILVVFLLFLFLHGCSDATAPGLVRLADGTLITEVESTCNDLLEGARIFEEADLLCKLDHTSEWHVFINLFEQGNADFSQVESVPLPLRSDEEGKLSLGPHMGIAAIVPVEPDISVHVEIRQPGNEPDNCLAFAIPLRSVPAFEKGNEPGVLKDYLERFGGEYRQSLTPSAEGDSLAHTLKLGGRTRSLLIMFVSCSSKMVDFNEVRITRVTPRNDFLLKRRENGIRHPAVAETPFIEHMVRPSFFLPPATAITLKALPIPEQARFRCSLGMIDESLAPLRFTLSAKDDKGNRHTLLNQAIDPVPGRWMDVELSLDPLWSREVKFTFTCAWADVGQDPPGSAPLVFCGSPIIYTPSLDSEDQDYNLILISLDTLRADHLGCYGYDRPVSPRMDRLAAESVLFRNAYAHSPWTLPSHASLFTSLYASTHGVIQYWDTLPEGIDLLAEILARQGLATASFNNGGFMSHEFGFHRGFDLYCEVDPVGDRRLDMGSHTETNVLHDGSRGSFKKVLSWIDGMKDQRFFLFLHTFMVHDYLPPQDLADEFNVGCASSLQPSLEVMKYLKWNHFKDHGLAEEDVVFFKNMYDATIRSADDMVGELLDHLESAGLSGKTVVVITSDHGEEFMDHGGIRHSKTVYEEMLRVPLIIHVPGRVEGRVVESKVPHIDVMPTLLELLGMESPRTAQGRSLTPLMDGSRGADRFIFAEVDSESRTLRRCFIQGEWKYIEGNTDPSLRYPAPSKAELYHLSNDPLERYNHADRNPEQQQSFEILLKEFQGNCLQMKESLLGGRTSNQTLSPELKEALRQQGYL